MQVISHVGEAVEADAVLARDRADGLLDASLVFGMEQGKGAARFRGAEYEMERSLRVDGARVRP